MKLTTLVPAIIAGACAAASIYLGSELADTRAQVTRREQARAADAERIRQLEESRRQVAMAPAFEARNLGASSAVTPPQPE